MIIRSILLVLSVTPLLLWKCNAENVFLPRSLQENKSYITAEDGTCHNSVGTKPVTDYVIRGRGLVFAIQSDEDDDDGFAVTSLGFHVASGGKVSYEVYTLSIEGYYANPERNPDLPSLLADETSYDYRGEMDMWELIAGGVISEDDLEQSSTTLAGTEPDFYQIPFDSFTKTRVPANGGVRSFYIATKSSAYTYVDPPEGKNLLTDELVLIGGNSADKFSPKILLGEGVADYPMSATPLLYQRKAFVGKLYYEKECPSEAPSTTTMPSAAPTITASFSPSTSPTLTIAPSVTPSALASEVPSSIPSLNPTEYFEEISDGLLLSLPMDCTPGEPIQESNESRAIRDSVQALTLREAGKDKTLSKIKVVVAGIFCTGTERLLLRRHLASTANDAFDEEDFFTHIRRLPTSSSAMDFSMVITGEYRPPVRPGQTAPPKAPSLGTLAEDSINADPVGFVKDLQERAGASSSLQQIKADDISVEKFEVPDDIDLENIQELPRATRKPTQRPTPAPTDVQVKNSGSINDDILFICLLVTGAIIVMLGAYLIFRNGQRQAAKRRRKEAAKRQEKHNEKVKKEALQRLRQIEAEKTRNPRRARDLADSRRSSNNSSVDERRPYDSSIGDDFKQNPLNPTYGYPIPPIPAPPQTYGRSPAPQHPPSYYPNNYPQQNFNYGGNPPPVPVPPPMPHGQYGGVPTSNPPAYPYPQVPVNYSHSPAVFVSQ